MLWKWDAISICGQSACWASQCFSPAHSRAVPSEVSVPLPNSSMMIREFSVALQSAKAIWKKNQRVEGLLFIYTFFIFYQYKPQRKLTGSIFDPDIVGSNPTLVNSLFNPKNHFLYFIKLIHWHTTTKRNILCNNIDKYIIHKIQYVQ